MKNAPNLKHLPKDKFTEAIIFAGEDACVHATAWVEDYGKKIAGDTTPPIYIGPKQLAELPNIRIVDKGRRAARVYLAGGIEPLQINAIGEKLALAGVVDARLYKGIPDSEPENWRDYLARVRDQIERGESLVAECNRTTRNHAEMDELVTGEALSPEEVAMLKEINRDFTHVTIGGKHKVVSLKPSQTGGVTHVFEDLAQFQHYFHHKPRVARKLAGTAWQSWAGKNYKPGGVGFYPIPDKCPNDVFNMFEGLALEPLEGDCSSYLEHLRHVICAGNVEAFHYLIQWMAHIIQKPDEKPAVAIVMKSVPGTGKGTTVKPLLQILGQYAAHINGAGHIAGRFNSILANKLLVFADEVTIRKPSESDRLKAIISEPTFNLERKGIDAEPMPNFSRLIFASNSTQVLQAGIRERRYLVLEPTPEKAQSREYFDRLHTWLENYGARKLLGYLLSVDISEFDAQRAPQTDALREEILQGLSGVELFLYSELIKVPPFNGEARLFASDMVNRFVMWSQERGEKVKDTAARSLVGKAFAQLGLKKHGRADRGQGIFYELPDAEELHQAFARLIGMGGYDVF